MGFISCQNNDDSTVRYIPTNQSLTALYDNALENKTQRVTFDAGTTFTFVSLDGVTLTINGNLLRKNGNVVTGNVNLEFIEIFDRGSMLVVNKPTMGLENGEIKLLTSGGEFFINVKQDDVNLTLDGPIYLRVPTSLTGGTDNDMLAFTGYINEDNDLIWEQDTTTQLQVIGSPTGEEQFYFIALNGFGWFNCDKYIAYPGEKTTITSFVPQGYNNDNASIFVAVSDLPNSLGSSWGEFPIGLEVSLIFITEEQGKFRYAVKSNEILTANHQVTFNWSDTNLATEEELIDIINAL
jgi:hypothetical protein